MIESMEFDDDISEVEEHHPLHRRGKCRQKPNEPDIIETIVIDEEPSQPDNNITNNVLYEDNKLLTEFIEKCLNLEQSDGMLRVINKNLLKTYKETDDKFKNSRKLQRVLNHAITRLEIDPNLKFNHVKNLCEVFKIHKKKKRAKLITLATNLKGNSQSGSQTTKRDFGETAEKRQKVDIIIDLDSEQDVDVIDLDDYIEDESMQIHEVKEKLVGYENNNENKFLETQVAFEPTTEAVVGNVNNEENNFLGPPHEFELRVESVVGNYNNDENEVLELPIEFEQSAFEPRIEYVVGNVNSEGKKVLGPRLEFELRVESIVGNETIGENKVLELPIKFEQRAFETRIESVVGNVNSEEKKILGPQLEFELRVESVVGNINDKNKVLEPRIEFKPSDHTLVSNENIEENESQGPEIEFIPSNESVVSLSYLAEHVPTTTNSTKAETLEPTEPDIDDKIKSIIKKIEYCKKHITILDEAEVTDDTINSPYIRCEKLKAKLVSHYKKLCQLTGEQAVKRREVHLQVLAGHPPGPVKRLEQFINDNIGSNGDPPFPDFCDVIKCVIEANEYDGLGWAKSKIMNEACALFTQCGCALQKRRQQREWRDLVSLVKDETCDVDPADENPQLLARLEENRRVAAKKETEILERYTKLQYKPKACSEIGGLNGAIINESDNSHSKTIENEVAKYVSSDSDTDNNNVTKTESGNSVSENIDDVNLQSEIKLKKEPLDINALLEELGDNYTVSVDIEDPFVVIEISSDSSDGED